MDELKTPNADKLTAKTDEWNAIYPFMEWLGGRGLFLARHETDEEALAKGSVWKDGSANTFPYPIVAGKRTDELLYEYFDVDPTELEKERRATLAKLGE
ncbi:hypothetical protein LCGC14_0688170 [marine sediment metagenome]|uniref:Uncharacterized protein n=1 Tax=marine sediment metagenome TaxID=412755 RepID=A0A0F9QR45_9ZZZZ